VRGALDDSTGWSEGNILWVRDRDRALLLLFPMKYHQDRARRKAEINEAYHRCLQCDVGRHCEGACAERWNSKTAWRQTLRS
jgi:radical SAM protein with 4Fe4S-binding SPASM domain